MEREIELLLQQVGTLQADKEDLRRRLDRAEEDRTIALRLLEGRWDAEQGVIQRARRFLFGVKRGKGSDDEAA